MDGNLLYETSRYMDAATMASACMVARHVNATINTHHPLHRRCIQVCYLLDATASMCFVMYQLYKFFERGIAQLQQRHATAHIEVAVVFYWDYDTPQFRVKVCDFGTSMHRILHELQSVPLRGGGDIPEAEKTGYHEALSLRWRTTGCSKVLLRIGDAPMHSDLHPPGYDIYGAAEKRRMRDDYDAVRLATRLRDKGIRVAALGILNPCDHIPDGKAAHMCRMMRAFNTLMATLTAGVTKDLPTPTDLVESIPAAIDLCVRRPPTASPDWPPVETEAEFFQDFCPGLG